MMLGCEGFWVGADEGKGRMLVLGEYWFWEYVGLGTMSG